MITESKIGKNVWYDDELWKVEKIISPNRYDDFLLLSRKIKGSIHPHGIVPIDMICIDCHNLEFYPNTKRVRELMLKRQKERELREKQVDEEKWGWLGKEWLSLFPHEDDEDDEDE